MIDPKILYTDFSNNIGHKAIIANYVTEKDPNFHRYEGIVTSVYSNCVLLSSNSLNSGAYIKINFSEISFVEFKWVE